MSTRQAHATELFLGYKVTRSREGNAGPHEDLRKMKNVQAGYVRFATIVVLGLLAGAMPAYIRPAAAETTREACTHDAFRLCGDAIPDVARTKACLAKNRSNLSSLCRAAFPARGSYWRRQHRRHG